MATIITFAGAAGFVVLVLFLFLRALWHLGSLLRDASRFFRWARAEPAAALWAIQAASRHSTPTPSLKPAVRAS